MGYQIQENIKNKLLILLDSNYCESFKEDFQSDIEKLYRQSLLTDSLLIETLNSIHDIAGMILLFDKVKNSDNKELVEILRNNSIEPSGMAYEKPTSFDEYQQLVAQLIRDMRALEIGNEVILREKRRTEIIKTIKESLSFLEIDNLNEEEINLVKSITDNISNEDAKNQVIENYNLLAQQVWNDFLNDSNNMLVHIGPVYGEYHGNVLSSSLIKKKEVATFTPSGEGVGIIIKPKTIVAADSKDLSTENYKQYEENYFKEIPIIKLPNQVEQEIIDKTKLTNGENLRYDGVNNPIYSEAAVKGFEKIGYIMIGYGDKSNTLEYKELKEKATHDNIEFKYVDINKMREKQNLQTINVSKNK